MSIALLVRDLVAAGASPEIIAIAVDAVEAAQAAAPARARSGSAERMARKRARDGASHVTADRVTCDAESDVRGDAGGANGDAEDLPLPPSPQTPQPPTPTRSGETPRAREADWPEGRARDHAEILARLNPNIDPNRKPGLVTTVGEIARWRDLGASWTLDVVPVVEAHALKAKHDPVASWKFFTEAIARALANRTRPAETVEPQAPHEPPRQSRRQAAFTERLSDIDRAMAEACK